MMLDMISDIKTGAGDGSGFGIVVISRQKRVVSFNAQMMKWFPGMVTGGAHYCGNVSGIPSDDAPHGGCPVERTINDRKSHEMTFSRMVGEESRRFKVFTSPLIGLDDELIAVVGFVEDLGSSMVSSRSPDTGPEMEYARLFTGNIAHDYRNILSVLKGNTMLLKEKAGDITGLSELIDNMEKAVERCLALTKRIEAFSLGRESDLGPTSLGRSIRESFDFLITGSKFSCVYDIPERLPAVTAELHQVEQVIINLGMNAMQAMPGGGRIDVSARPVDIGEDNGLFLAEGEYVEISMKDRGEGIDEKIIPYIFIPHFTTRKDGTGLGLSLCRVIAQKNGGDIEVESRVGKGTTVRIYLPVSR